MTDGVVMGFELSISPKAANETEELTSKRGTRRTGTTVMHSSVYLRKQPVVRDLVDLRQSTPHSFTKISSTAQDTWSKKTYALGKGISH